MGRLCVQRHACPPTSRAARFDEKFSDIVASIEKRLHDPCDRAPQLFVVQPDAFDLGCLHLLVVSSVRGDSTFDDAPPEAFSVPRLGERRARVHVNTRALEHLRKLVDVGPHHDDLKGVERIWAGACAERRATMPKHESSASIELEDGGGDGMVLGRFAVKTFDGGVSPRVPARERVGGFRRSVILEDERNEDVAHDSPNSASSRIDKRIVFVISSANFFASGPSVLIDARTSRA